MILGLPGTVFAALGIAVLAYRVYLTLGGEFSLPVQDVAMLSSVRFATGRGGLADMFGITSVFDFSRAHSLLRQRVDAQLSVLLVTTGAALSLGGLMAPRGTVPLWPITVAFVVGLAAAWAITRGYRALWRRLRQSSWLAHCWLAWLERQSADPLAPSLNVSQDVIHIVMASPHPDLERFMHERFAGQPITGGVRDAIERWIADFALRWKYQFGSDPWRAWSFSRRSESH